MKSTSILLECTDNSSNYSSGWIVDIQSSWMSTLGSCCFGCYGGSDYLSDRTPWQSWPSKLLCMFTLCMISTLNRKNVVTGWPLWLKGISSKICGYPCFIFYEGRGESVVLCCVCAFATTILTGRRSGPHLWWWHASSSAVVSCGWPFAPWIYSLQWEGLGFHFGWGSATWAYLSTP